MKFKDYLRKLNKIKIGCFANKGKSNDYFSSLKIISRKTKKKIPQIKSNQVIISCYQEEYKRLTCKIIRKVFLYRRKPVNRNSSVKEGTFTQIS